MIGGYTTQKSETFLNSSEFSPTECHLYTRKDPTPVCKSFRVIASTIFSPKDSVGILDFLGRTAQQEKIHVVCLSSLQRQKLLIIWNQWKNKESIFKSPYMQILGDDRIASRV